MTEQTGEELKVVRIPPEMDEADGVLAPELTVAGVPLSGSGLSLNLPPDLSETAWVDVGRSLSNVHRNVQWLIGDWWAYGEHRYGARAAMAAENVFGRSFGNLRNLGVVARRFGPETRDEGLTFYHYRQVTPLDDEVASTLLEQAKMSGWSARQLRDEAQRHRALTDPPAPEPDENPFGYALRFMARTVGAIFDLDASDFIGEAKGSPVQVHARQILIYLLVTEADFQQSEVAQSLGRHHSTIGHALEVVTELRNEPEIDRAFTALGEMYRSLRDARANVPKLVEALAP